MLTADGRSRRLAKLIREALPTGDDFQVVYAIIPTRPEKRWPTRLPFFSQLKLVNGFERLTPLGYKAFPLQIDKRAGRGNRLSADCHGMVLAAERKSNAS